MFSVAAATRIFNRPPTLHRIACIRSQIDERGLELVGISFDRQWPLGDLELERRRRSRHRLEHVGDAFELGGHVEHLATDGLTSGKSEQLPGQLGSAVGGVRNRIHISPHSIRRQIAAPQQIGRRSDHREQVVEVVGDATCELPDRLHLLRLTEGLLGLAALGEFDRLRHDRNDLALRIAHRPHLEVEPAPPADRQVHVDFLAHASRRLRPRRRRRAPCPQVPACW